MALHPFRLAPMKRIQKAVVVGGGSAGFLAALSLRALLPSIEVTLIHSSKIPVIGVGESTTVAIPRFLHDILKLPRRDFYEQVRPSWKLGIRFEWGKPGDSHFNYTFDKCVDIHLHPLERGNAYHCLTSMSDASLYYTLMDSGSGPCFTRPDGRVVMDPGVAYHIENKPFIGYLERQARALGAEVIDAGVTEIVRDTAGFVTELKLDDGHGVAGDLFLDCSGFRSELLGRAMGVPYRPYAGSLFCDAAMVGSWTRTSEPLLPYTISETMNHGWCWRIEFEKHITRGYVYSSEFCTAEEAASELRAKNPQLAAADLREVKFRSGRYERFWEKNVVAIGNASGFVEPLEATALHLIVEQLRLLRQGLSEGQQQLSDQIIAVQNRRFAGYWDDVRDFLAIHYAFNRRSDTPFWRHCLRDTDLGGAAELVELYRRVGPSSLCASLIPTYSIFGFNGYLTMLIGQRLPTDCQFEPTAAESGRWAEHRMRVRSHASRALRMESALQLVHDPDWRWPEEVPSAT